MGQGSGRRGGSRKLGHHTHIICLSLSLYFALCCLEIFLSFTFTHFFLPLTHTPTQYQSFVIPELTPSRATVAINKLKCVQCLAWPEALERHTHTINIQTLNARSSAPVTWFNTQPYTCIHSVTRACVCLVICANTHTHFTTFPVGLFT